MASVTSGQPRPYFQNLPTEILLMILEEIENYPEEPPALPPGFKCQNLPGFPADFPSSLGRLSHPVGFFPSSAAKALARLAQTCQRLARLAPPYIYKKELFLSWTATTEPPIVLLLRTLFFRPDYVSMVSKLRLVGWTKCLQNGEETGIWKSFSEPEVDALKNSVFLWGGRGIAGYDSDIYFRWIRGLLLYNDYEAMVGLMILILFNVHTIHIDVEYPGDKARRIYLEDVFRMCRKRGPLVNMLALVSRLQFIPQPPPFSIVQHIQLCNQAGFDFRAGNGLLWKRTIDTDPINILQPLLSFPFLQNLNVSLVDAMPTEAWVGMRLPFLHALGSPPPRSVIGTSIRTLALTTVRILTLHGLLLRCPYVEDLSYLLNTPITHDQAMTFKHVVRVRLDMIRTALVYTVGGRNLRRLSVRLDWDCGVERMGEVNVSGDCLVEERLGPLIELEELEHLEVSPLVFLGPSFGNEAPIHVWPDELGWDIAHYELGSWREGLPSSLRSLTVLKDSYSAAYCGDWWDNQMLYSSLWAVIRRLGGARVEETRDGENAREDGGRLLERVFLEECPIRAERHRVLKWEPQEWPVKRLQLEGKLLGVEVISGTL